MEKNEFEISLECTKIYGSSWNILPEANKSEKSLVNVNQILFITLINILRSILLNKSEINWTKRILMKNVFLHHIKLPSWLFIRIQNALKKEVHYNITYIQDAQKCSNIGK